MPPYVEIDGLNPHEALGESTLRAKLADLEGALRADVAKGFALQDANTE